VKKVRDSDKGCILRDVFDRTRRFGWNRQCVVRLWGFSATHVSRHDISRVNAVVIDCCTVVCSIVQCYKVLKPFLEIILVVLCARECGIAGDSLAPFVIRALQELRLHVGSGRSNKDAVHGVVAAPMMCHYSIAVLSSVLWFHDFIKGSSTTLGNVRKGDVSVVIKVFRCSLSRGWNRSWSAVIFLGFRGWWCCFGLEVGNIAIHLFLHGTI